MSNKLEAALGGEPANTFTDEDGDVYRAERHGEWFPLITLSVSVDGGEEPLTIDFRAEDATKIIALIAEAAK